MVITSDMLNESYTINTTLEQYDEFNYNMSVGYAEFQYNMTDGAITYADEIVITSDMLNASYQLIGDYLTVADYSAQIVDYLNISDLAYTGLDDVVFSNGTNVPSTWDITNYTAGTGITVSEHEIASTITDTTCATSGTCPQIYEDTTLLSNLYLKITDFFTHIDNIIVDYYNKTEADNAFAGIEWDYNQSDATYTMWNTAWSVDTNTDDLTNVVFSNGTNLPETWDVTNYTAGTGITVTNHVITSTVTSGDDLTNVAFVNNTNTFALNQTFNEDIILSQDQNMYMGAGRQYYNGSCMIIRGLSSTMEIC